MIYPWLESNLVDLLDRYAEQRLPHALLMTGQVGIGKAKLASVFAQRLLCEQNSACGSCKGCSLFNAGSHPDFRLVQLEDDAQQIKIEQIRDLIHWVTQTAQMSGSKVTVINPAHKMNRNSANALLKVMEEPPSNNFLVLVSEEPALLLPTIRSRAQRVALTAPGQAEALDWLSQFDAAGNEWPVLLDLSHGSPLLAQERANEEFLRHRQELAGVWKQLWSHEGDVVALAASVAKGDLIELIELGLALLADVARVHATGRLKSMKNRDLTEIVEGLNEALERRHALACVQRLQQDLRLAKGSQNPNQALLLEALFMACRADHAGAPDSALGL